MAFVPGYDHDIFISYSHANNQAGWVNRFRDKLTERLKEYLGDEPKVFLDLQTIQGNDNLDARIDHGITRTAILVPIVSRSYITREWCQLECREFRTTNPETAIGTRIFPVRYDDVSPADFQAHVGRLIGYFFHGKEEGAKFVDAFETDSREFKTQMNTLRTEIGERLLMLKQQTASLSFAMPKTVTPVVVPTATSGKSSMPPIASVSSSPASLAAVTVAAVPPQTPATDMATARPTVMLGESTRHLQRFRENITGFLRGYHINVVQPGDRFYELPNYATEFNQQLEKVDLFVQLLGRFFDPYDDDTLHSWEEWQHVQATTANKPSLCWFQKFDKDNREIDLTLLDAAHRDFVKRASAWDNDLELFKQLVLERVQASFQDRRQQARTASADDVRPLIVLRADKSDAAFADQISRTLADQQFDCVRVPDKEVTSLEEFCRENSGDGMIVVYRSCPGRWVLTRLQEMRKFLKSDIGNRWACGLWRAPEDEADALTCSVDGLMVIEPPDQKKLPAFLGEVRQRLSGAKA